MSWAGERRLFILIILGVFVAAVVGTVSIATLYHAPSCTDGVQNEGEQGVDCGGPCTNLCTALEEPPTVLFTQAIPNGVGRTDVAALVENKNPDAAAKAVPYTVTLYGPNQALVARVAGTLELPPNASVPVFVPGVASGNQTVVNAFLTIDPTAVSWYRMPVDPRTLPQVSNITLGGTTAMPAITATFTDASATALTNVKSIVFVRDAQGNVLAASETLTPTIPAQGSAVATYTWNAPFRATPSSIEVFPAIPLP